MLVTGASGGVGTFAVQIAKAFGAEVTGVCSTRNLDMVRSIGADRVIDYTKHDFTELVRDQHVLFDNVGNRAWSETSRVLAAGGVNVSVTGPKHAVMGPMRRFAFRKLLSRSGDKQFTWFTAQVKREDLEFLADLLESRDLEPVIEKTFPLSEVPDALRYLGEGHAHGKLVIAM